jgi:hypothetical protein|tara:strand:- start:2 stop:811 length:810 start_codon:yes stop_codon:yes gene_type:complete
MRDFTLQAYETYINLIKESGLKIITFNDLFSYKELPEEFFIIRHDVDRKPKNALRMATLESNIGINSTYYFRSNSHVFKPEIILSIFELGHDIGYHYECLSDSGGDIDKALDYFEKNLRTFRLICDIKTISMHGSPLSPYNNLDMWRSDSTHKMISDRFDLIGEISLDIDYSNIAYINDTGRNWSSTNNNIRDNVNSNILFNINSSDELITYLSETIHKKIVFQIHPERWSENNLQWFIQWLTDRFANIAKNTYSRLGESKQLVLGDLI